MYDKVLVAIDDGEPSSRALEQAGGIAVLSKGSVQVLNVREHVIGRRAGAEFYLSEEEDAKTLVDHGVAQLRDRGVEASGVVVGAPQGRAAEAIWEQAEAMGADLVVLGSHGRTAIGSIFLGSVAYHVIHLARGPVLVVR